MADLDFDPKELVVFGRMLAALGVSPTSVIRRALEAEQNLAAYARTRNISLSPEGRAQIPADGLAEALREVPEALDAPSFVRHVMYLRNLAANPSESLWATLGAGGLEFIYRTAGPDPPSIPHSHQDGATAWNLTKQTEERLDRETEGNRLEDLPLGAPLGEKTPVPVPSRGPDLTPVLAVLRKVANALAKPRRRYAFLDEAKLHQAIALNHRRKGLMADRMLTETESWKALAVDLASGKQRRSSKAAALRKFVERTFKLNLEHPEKFRMAYRRGGASPPVPRAIDEPDKRTAVDGLMRVLRQRSNSLSR